MYASASRDDISLSLCLPRLSSHKHVGCTPRLVIGASPLSRRAAANPKEGQRPHVGVVKCTSDAEGTRTSEHLQGEDEAWKRGGSEGRCEGQ